MPTALTVTATQGGSTANGMLLRVKVLTGASSNQFGATASTSQNSTFAPNQSITTTVTGSWVYGALVNGQPATQGTAFTAATGNTILDSVHDATNSEQYGTCRTTAQTGTPGATTVGASAPATMSGGMAYAEILPSGTMAEDPSSPAAVSTTSATTLTTASFTPPDGSLLVAMVATDGGSGSVTMTVSGGGLTWSPLVEANSALNDYAGIWAAQVGPPDPGDPVITATQGGSTGAGMAMRIFVLTGAKPAAQQPGATTNNQFASTATFTQSITTTAGSNVYGASSHTVNTDTATGSNATVVDDISDGTNLERYVTFKALNVTAGATARGFTSSGSDSGPFAQAEILAAGTLAEDASAPPVASTTSATFVSCTNFTPPAGALLVILIASDGGTGVTTMSVSGGGLVFAELVKNNPSGGDYAGVWVADAGGPAGAATRAAYAPGWHPGTGLPGLPGGIPFLSFPDLGGSGGPVAAAGSGPPVYPPGHPVQARQLPLRGGTASHRAGVFAQAGPPVYAPHGPARAQPAVPLLTGRVTRRTGAYGGTGPPVKPAPGPVAAKGRGLPPRGRTASRAGVFAQLGAPVTPPHGPVQAKTALARTLGRATGRAGTFTSVAIVSGAPIYPLGHPVQARRLPQRGGTAQARAGTFTAAAQTGPPVYPLGHPVRTRPQPPPRGRIIRAAGTYAGTGAPAVPLRQPVSAARRPLPARGRTASQRGPYGGTGPPTIPLRRPVRGQPQKPLLTGRAAWRTGTYTAPLIAPFTVGALSAATVPVTTLGAGTASSALTAGTAAPGMLTARDQRTGGPS